MKLVYMPQTKMPRDEFVIGAGRVIREDGTVDIQALTASPDSYYDVQDNHEGLNQIDNAMLQQVQMIADQKDTIKATSRKQAKAAGIAGATLLGDIAMAFTSGTWLPAVEPLMNNFELTEGHLATAATIIAAGALGVMCRMIPRAIQNSQIAYQIDTVEAYSALDEEGLLDEVFNDPVASRKLPGGLRRAKEEDPNFSLNLTNLNEPGNGGWTLSGIQPAVGKVLAKRNISSRGLNLR